jgi:hypothetical protein
LHAPQPPTIVRPLMWRIPLLAVLLVAGCGAEIGDACKSNIDCSPLGDRFCDTAPPNGYCTKEDCGPTSCPSEAVCIRFFTPLEDESCTFNSAIPFSRSDCPNVDDRCVCDTSNGSACTCPPPGVIDPASGNCTVSNGHCAPSSTERHWCQRSCSNNGDCRDGYACRSTGTFGAEPLPAFNNGLGTPAKFCAPEPMSF